ncbi:hypothetical protein HETIRDRAFT_149236 [Heterobasidion irregulare TC 32-1]|uniref:Uncharacterized protein n=1 Tax=Heterobasidion irregulare (strain TC 32-1) TaxID=747525 RepID=W4KED9_HETIT|nr:uncharacterized protein HETIRDRAFT_149236 [Heterobasidion irregulare TC 32-1]ETW83421.1 hypothetical protein HETIRDRAFT_149236 [Heterobasidion irregulare TC 32-1]
MHFDRRSSENPTRACIHCSLYSLPNMPRLACLSVSTEISRIALQLRPAPRARLACAVGLHARRALRSAIYDQRSAL